jgi:hypothetical protein
MSTTPLLSPDDVADLAQVKRTTVLRWNRQLPCLQPNLARRCRWVLQRAVSFKESM